MADAKLTLERLFSQMMERVDFKVTSYGGTILFRVHGDGSVKEFQITDCARYIAHEEFADVLSAKTIRLEVKTDDGRGGALKIYLDNQLMHSATLGANKTWAWDWKEDFSVWDN
jgi:hypothetical protein